MLISKSNFLQKLDGIRLRAQSKMMPSVIEQFYKPKRKKFFKFKFNCNPLTCSQNIVITSNFSYTHMTPLIFDLMTLKSTQFIGSARFPELNSNPSVSSNENASTSYFCIHNEPMTFDLMKPFIGSARYINDLSLAGIHQSVLMIIRSQAIFAYIMRRMTLTFTSWPPKSNQFISSASNIHDLSLAGIHQSVLEIRRSRAVFAYTMCAVTFDLVTPKI